MPEDPRDADQAAIARLMTGWIHRDLSEWDELARLFHPGATIDISWIRGTAEEFVAGSKRMGQGPFRSKHVIASPVIQFNGDRAFVETNAIIYIENLDLRLGIEQHNRFLDQVSKVDGEWRINHRDSVYDMGWFIYPYGVALADPVDPALIEGHPREYAAMAYLNARSGHPLDRPCVVRGSAEEAEIKARGQEWLRGA